MASGDDNKGSAGSAALVKYELQTTFSDTTTLNWIIKDFDRLYEACDDVGDEIVHLEFGTGTKFGIRTYGRVYFQKPENVDSVALYLKLSSPCPVQGNKIQAWFNVATETNKGELIYRYADIDPRDDDYEDFTSDGHWGSGWDYFMNFIALRQKYLKGGILKLRFTIKLRRITDTLMISNNELQDEMLNKDLFQGFEKLLLSGQFSDVTFIFSGEDDKDMELKAHKLVLSLRSPIFEAMFNTEMMEGLTGKVMIDDISAKAFKIMLRFIYTGKLNEEWGPLADELIHAANKYQLTTLKEILERKILDVITVDNAVKIHKMAKLCNLKNAEKDIEMYIKDHLTEFLRIL